jgi:hypothetical protein
MVCTVPKWSVDLDESNLTVPDGLTRMLGQYAYGKPYRTLYNRVNAAMALTISTKDGVVSARTPGDMLQRCMEQEGLVCPCNMNNLTPVIKYLHGADAGNYVSAGKLTINTYLKCFLKHQAALTWLANTFKQVPQGYARNQVKAGCVYMYEFDPDRANNFLLAYRSCNSGPGSVPEAGLLFRWLSDPNNTKAKKKDGSAAKGYGGVEQTVFFATSYIMHSFLNNGRVTKRVLADRNYFLDLKAKVKKTAASTEALAA